MFVGCVNPTRLKGAPVPKPYICCSFLSFLARCAAFSQRINEIQIIGARIDAPSRKAVAAIV